MKKSFNQRKKSILSKKDKSSKGSLDKKITPLCRKINSLKNHYTTSSCSGRIVLLIDKNKKKRGLFIKTYHNLINFKTFKNDLNKIDKSNLIKFKQEPPILHVACKNLEDAFELLDKSRSVGWKRSGIISRGNSYFVELMSTEKLEFLIMDNKKILVDDNYLRLIIKKSNENLKKGWKKIKNFKKVLD